MERAQLGGGGSRSRRNRHPGPPASAPQATGLLPLTTNIGDFWLFCVHFSGLLYSPHYRRSTFWSELFRAGRCASRDSTGRLLAPSSRWPPWVNLPALIRFITLGQAATVAVRSARRHPV